MITGHDPDYFHGRLPESCEPRCSNGCVKTSGTCWRSRARAFNEGKTLTAINLAISLAMEVSYTVLLVDADLRHPNVHTYFGLEPEFGLSDYLVSDKPLQELLVHPAGIQGLVILPGGKPLINSAEMLNSPKMSRLVEELKTRYPSRIVLFDLPPSLTTADAVAFAPYVDAALLVVEEGKTSTQDAQRATELLKDTHLIGAVLNKSLSNPADDGQARLEIAPVEHPVEQGDWKTSPMDRPLLPVARVAEPCTRSFTVSRESRFPSCLIRISCIPARSTAWR